ncbi:nuclear transport factor 2 family protein [Micromonospora sp. WMMA1998]|uniref:nuclear transport factor 2 family protein n=1 Tax=Micromonospora sp. WMMA1998 TaxID=3015167 RepID=UPI00248B0B86|nr:nuclear transport factor 2 family protein [Micromonospora sp. WMMA1998]WBC15958.1 nuclear transport factor 2 family protein [Micromonospora sp. WMMA1998]
MADRAREVVERILRAGRDGDVEAFVALMAPEGYIEWPFRPAGVPGRVRGRADVRRHLIETAGTLITFDEYRDVVIHETLDPEVVVVEYEAVGSVVATAEPFEQTVIAVFRVQDGLVVSYRDYINPLPLMEALTGGAGNR